MLMRKKKFVGFGIEERMTMTFSTWKRKKYYIIITSQNYVTIIFILYHFHPYNGWNMYLERIEIEIYLFISHCEITFAKWFDISLGKYEQETNWMWEEMSFWEERWKMSYFEEFDKFISAWYSITYAVWAIYYYYYC